MKILLTTDWYKPVINGVVTSVINLADGLTSLGHEVRILTLSGNRRSYQNENVTYIGSVSAGKVYPDARLRIKRGSRLLRELIRWQPDIVHSQCEFSTFIMAAKIARSCQCPLVHTYHTVYEDFTHYFSPSYRVGKKMASVVSRKILNRTTRVIVPTEKIYRMLLEYGVETPITVVPSGLKLSRFQDACGPEEREALRKKWGIDSSDFVLLYLGRLAKEKNVEEILELLKKARRPDIKMLLVGDGPYCDMLKLRVKELALQDQVIFVGMVPPDTTGKYYQSADLFVSASQSETQGLTYAEAMASSLPLLCRQDPCLNQMVEQGVNGFTYTDEEEFQQALQLMVENEGMRLSMGREAARKAVECFSQETFAAKVEAVYRQLM